MCYFLVVRFLNVFLFWDSVRVGKDLSFGVDRWVGLGWARGFVKGRRSRVGIDFFFRFFY